MKRVGTLDSDKQRVLLVDDEAAFAAMLLYHLETHGFLVEHVTNGQEALAIRAEFFLVSRARVRLKIKMPLLMREASPAPRVLSEAWSDAHWVLLGHATRSALAVALLPLVWRWFEIEDFSQTALTSIVIMFVPDAVVREGRHRAIIERMIHRAAGCRISLAAERLGTRGTDALATAVG